MSVAGALRSVVDIESFMVEFYAAWGGMDEDRIMSYYTDNVTLEIPGSLMQGKSAVLEQFVRPFIAAFPGNRHFVKNIIFGGEVAVIEFTFRAEHKGPFAGHSATNACIELPGCGIYEYDSARRQISAARIYFDVGTLLKQIVDQRQLHLKTEEAAAAPTGTIAIATPMEHLDLASVIAIALENTRLYRDLADREGKIRRLVEANVLGICIWNLEGAIVEANEAFLHMLHYRREDVVSGRLRWTDLTPAEWREQDERAVAELRSTGTFQPVEKEYFRKDGSRVPVLIGGALFEENGNEGVAFVLDLTERKRAEEEHERLRQLESDLAHVNRLSIMGELAASMAHEVLHPIATARNNARAGMRFLEISPPNLDEVREALSCVVRDADRAKDIIGRVRDHIKKAPPRRELFDLNKAVSEVIVMVRSAIAKNGIAVTTELMYGLAPVQGDRVQLQQVVLNLVLNAIEAMGSVEVGGRELLVSTEQTEDEGVLVAVRDSGPGIDPGHLDRVFEAFYTTKTSGVGMGLSICRSIIDAHGGRLWANANEPRGAVFCFTLPAARGGS